MSQTSTLLETAPLIQQPPAAAVVKRELEYRPDVDGLRAVAVLAVVAFHAFPEYFPGGFVGVDVFFVISGFLISSILFRELQRGTFTIAGFYRRRIRRIFPALAAVLSACLLFGWYALLPDEFELLGKHVAAAAVFVSNFVSWQEVGYFDRAAALKPLLHLWSLGIEEQFYLFWPLLLMFLWKRPRSIGATIILLSVASFALSVELVNRGSTADYYFPLARFWELGIGCLLAYRRRSGAGPLFPKAGESKLAASHPGSASEANSALGIAGVALIATSLFAFDTHTPFPGWAALLPTLGAACVLAAPTSCWFQRKVMGHPVLVFIGLISYPLYLWHWPLLSYATILASETPSLGVRSTAAVLSIVLAWLTYQLIEIPIRRRSRPHMSLGLTSALAVLGIAGLAIYLAGGVDQRFKVDVRAIRQGPRTDAQCLASFPGAGQGVVNYCKTTATGADVPQAIFMGDSRTQAVYDATVATVGREHPMMLLGRGGCPPLLDIQIDDDAREKSCNTTWQALVKYVRSTRPKMVVLVGGGSRYFVDDPQAAAAGSEATLRAFKEGLSGLIVQLQEVSQVVYVRELPGYGSAPSCFLRRIQLPGTGCVPDEARSRVEASMAAYNQALDEVHGLYPELRLVDSIPALCGPRLCSQRTQSGQVLYADELHLSPAGGRLFVASSGLSSLIAKRLASP